MERLARRKIRVFYYATSFLAMLALAVALSVPYFISVRKQFDAMVDESRSRIFGEKRDALAERVERVIAEIEVIRETVYAEYQALAKAQCSLLSTLKMKTSDIISGFDRKVSKRTSRFLLHNSGVGIAVYDREKQSWKAVEGVNITLGLPIIRTSVDHGTGFALAGKGTSNELSLVNAIDYAVRMTKGRKTTAAK